MKHAKDDVLAEALTQCTDLLRAGLPLRECLTRYPEYATDLEPLLQTVAQVRQQRAVPARAPVVVEQRRSQFMLAAQQAAAARTSSAGAPARPAVAAVGLAAWWQRLAERLFGPGGISAPRAMPVGLAVMLFLVFILGFSVTGLVDASSAALPGDTLFPVKIGLEDMRLLMTRDPAARAQFEAQRAILRRDEAKTIADTGRAMDNLELTGVIEELRGDAWQVSGLEVLIAPDTVIVGQPALGATVQGTMKAPGDHTLVAVYVEIEPHAASGAAADSAAQGQAVPNPAAPPPVTAPTGTPTSTPEPTADTGFAVLPLATGMINEPTEEPTSTSTALPTATATRTVRPTSTAPPMPTSTATLPAPPRDLQTGRLIGFVTRIEGGWWTIDEVTVETDADTQYSGNPGVGSKVEVIVAIRPNGSLVAIAIRTIGAPQPTPSPWEFVGIVEGIDGDAWNIGGSRVKVTGETVLEQNPGIGDTVEVKGQLRGGVIWALRIKALREIEYHFEGVVELIEGGSWVISGNRIIVDGATQISGDPTIGSRVQVRAVRRADGQLYAKSITAAPEPTAEPTAVPTATATAAPTLEPTAMSTVEPTATSTAAPIQKPTAESTATPVTP
jgi:hypothetical protein